MKSVEKNILNEKKKNSEKEEKEEHFLKTEAKTKKSVAFNIDKNCLCIKRKEKFFSVLTQLDLEQSKKFLEHKSNIDNLCEIFLCTFCKNKIDVFVILKDHFISLIDIFFKTQDAFFKIKKAFKINLEENKKIKDVFSTEFKQNMYKFKKDVFGKIVDIIEVLNLGLEKCNLTVCEDDRKGKTLFDGVKIAINKFMEVLSNYKITKINVKIGQKFDYRFHSACATVKNNKYGNNIVVEVVKNGYLLEDEVIFPAIVVINRIVGK